MGSPFVKVSAALAGVNRLYIEAAPLVYYAEENLKYVERVEAIITAVEVAPIEAVSSVITLTEVLTHPLRLGQIHYAQEYRDILLHNSGFRLLPVTESIADSAASLRARYNLRTPDAVHAATAIRAACDAFLTNDRNMRRITELRVLVLDELEFDPPT